MERSSKCSSEFFKNRLGEESLVTSWITITVKSYFSKVTLTTTKRYTTVRYTHTHTHSTTARNHFTIFHGTLVRVCTCAHKFVRLLIAASLALSRSAMRGIVDDHYYAIAHNFYARAANTLRFSVAVSIINCAPLEKYLNDGKSR